MSKPHCFISAPSAARCSPLAHLTCFKIHPSRSACCPCYLSLSNLDRPTNRRSLYSHLVYSGAKCLRHSAKTCARMHIKSSIVFAGVIGSEPVSRAHAHCLQQLGSLSLSLTLTLLAPIKLDNEPATRDPSSSSSTSTYDQPAKRTICDFTKLHLYKVMMSRHWAA